MWTVSPAGTVTVGPLENIPLPQSVVELHRAKANAVNELLPWFATVRLVMA